MIGSTVTITQTPSPSPTQICGEEGFTSGHLIILCDSDTLFDCQQQCLTTTGCESFQHDTDEGFCNLFSAPAYEVVQPQAGSGSYVYDVSCAIPVKRALPVKRAASTTPALLSFLEALAATKISSACSCLITSAPTVHTTVGAKVTSTSTGIVGGLLSSTLQQVDDMLIAALGENHGYSDQHHRYWSDHYCDCNSGCFLTGLRGFNRQLGTISASPGLLQYSKCLAQELGSQHASHGV